MAASRAGRGTIAAIAVVLLALVPGPALGSPSARGTVLVAVSNAATGTLVRISLVDVASGSSRRILQGKSLWSQSVSWSPDGRSIAFAEGTHVEVAGADGHHLRRLPQLATSPGGDAGVAFPSFAWAPSSRSVADSEADGHRLVIRGIDGGARVVRRAGPHEVILNVSWSPNGRWLAYDEDGMGAGPNGAGCCSMTLHLVHPDGSDDHRVASMRDAEHDTPSTALWTHDGRRLAFGTEAFDTHDPTVAVVAADTGTLRSLPVRNAVPLGWSRDGHELAAVEGSANGRASSLALFDGVGVRHALTTARPPTFVGAWSADGTQLAVSGGHATGPGDLELVDPTGGAPRVIEQLPHGSRVELVAWRPA